MATYTVENPQNGRKVTFMWDGKEAPTESDIDVIFAEADKLKPPPGPTELTAEEQFAAKNPNLYGLYGAGRALLRTGIEGAGTAGGAALGAMSPIPGGALAGAGAGYAGSTRAADALLGEPVDTSVGGIAKDVAIGGAMQGAGGLVGRGIMRAMPQAMIDKLYASALKLPTSPQKMSIAERKATINTGLAESAVPNIETGSVGKMLGFRGYNNIIDKVNDFGQEINTIIKNATANNKTISSNEVVKRLDDLLAKGDRLTKADPNFKASIEKAKKEFLEGSDEITAANAQEMKQHIYKVYQNYYGIDDATAAYVQGKKALARGLKEELETIHPDIKNLNMSEGKLLEFLDPLGRAVGRIQNRDILSLGLQMSPMMGSALTGGSGTAAKIGLASKFIDTPSVKARLAILLNRAKGAGTSKIRQAAGKATPLAIIAGGNRED